MGMTGKGTRTAKAPKAAPLSTKASAEWVPINSVSPDPENARERTPRNLRTIRASLKRFGQRKPIVVDADGIIRAGNGTWHVAKELGWTEIWISRSHLRGAEAVAYAIADNRSNDQSQFDEVKLASSLGQLPPELLEAAGFDDIEADELLPKLEQYSDGEEATGEKQRHGASNMIDRSRVTVRPVIAVDKIEVIERALSATGLMNREAAMLEIASAYLRAKGQ